MSESRRQFLKHTLAATAACGLARHGAASAPLPAAPIVDTHVYVGHWPHQRLLDEDLANLATNLRRKNVVQAWVSSFEGLFHKDIAAVNQRLADAVHSVSPQNQPIHLQPFGTINPTLPDWENDARRCHEKFEMRGVRLHPNYHGYALDDSRFSRLLEMCSADGLIVQIACWMEDERRHLLSPPATHVDLKPLAEKVAAVKGIQLVISNGYRTASDDMIRALLPMNQIYFDIARAKDGMAIRELVDRTSAQRVLFGSCTPLHEIAAPLAAMQNAQLTPSLRSAIEITNANEVFNHQSH